MDRFLRLLRAPGSRKAIEITAPTVEATTKAVCQDQEDDSNGNRSERTTVTAASDESYLQDSSRSWRLDRWLDKVVEWSGSQFVFVLILCGLLAWAFLGIVFSEFTDWQVGISDGQAIINLVFDSFLMRQQLTAYKKALNVLGLLRSRGLGDRRMLRKLVQMEKESRSEEDGSLQHLARMEPQLLSQFEKEELEKAARRSRDARPHQAQQQQQQQQQIQAVEEGCQDLAAGLPRENLFGRFCTTVSDIAGHIITVAIFWVGIIIWISFGARDNWSSTWLLYINSATSALMVFILAFLANIRERHSEYSNRCLDAIWKVDRMLELKLRTATNDTEAHPSVTIPAPRVNRVQRVIDYYADLVGALIGIAILILTMIIWVVIGPAMQFSSNWWLLIGTYAGLVGMNDGFVLRNVFHKMQGFENELFGDVRREDEENLGLLLPALDDGGGDESNQQRRQQHGQFNPAIEAEAEAGTEGEQSPTQHPHPHLTQRISLRIGRICSHEYTVILGLLLIIALVITASAMGWSLTGQLLCNVPPSIIETFFMMILITGHNLGDRRRRGDLEGVYAWRVVLLRQVESVVVGGGGGGDGGVRAAKEEKKEEKKEEGKGDADEDAIVVQG